MALVGGVNLALSVEGFEGPHLAGMLSPEGRCKTFSADADGYGRGEGVVALLLKPLADAEADGDNILGVLIGGAVNHGGRAGALTAPNAKAQADLIERAMAGIDPASIGYIETHGTGTDARRSGRDRRPALGIRPAQHAGRPLPSIGLGAVKSNIGHLEAAAGLAGVVKVLGAMQRGEIPPTLHCRDINPHIELDGSPFHIVRERAPWPRLTDGAGAELPRRGGVSSFGFGGVNAHVVLEEYPGGANRRAPLPGHRFADTRFWIPGSETGEDAPPMKPFCTSRNGPKRRCLDATAAATMRRLVLACGVDCAGDGFDARGRLRPRRGRYRHALHRCRWRNARRSPVGAAQRRGCADARATRASARRRRRVVLWPRRVARYGVVGMPASHRPGRRRVRQGSRLPP